MDCIEVGDLVAPKQNLQNRNRPDATLPAGRLGVVDAVGPTYIRVEIAWNTYYYARPEDLVIVEKEFLTDYAAVTRSPNIAAVWDEQQGDTRRIVARFASAGSSRFGAPLTLSDGTSAFYPHIVGANDGFLVAWAARTGEKSSIVIQRVQTGR